MKNVFEISFNEKDITIIENLYPIFKLRAFLQGKPTAKIQTIKWNEVREAYVYKRDVLTIDLICLAFRTSAGVSREFNEEMSGWENLVDNLPKYLPNCLAFEEWFMEVAFPAFELNLIKIYPREK